MTTSQNGSAVVISIDGNGRVVREQSNVWWHQVKAKWV